MWYIWLVEFEWDDRKAAANFKKHGLLFPYATRAFLDEGRIEWLDVRQEYGEDRFVTIGMIDAREIVVVYTWRDEKIRLISARKADQDEIEAYWKNR